MKKSNILFVAAIIIIAAASAWSLLTYSKASDDSGNKLQATGAEKMIESGDLSDHKADYYKEVE